MPVLPSSLTNERCQPLPGVRSSAMMRTSSGHPRREVLAGSALAAVVAIALTACSPSPQPAAFPTASATPTSVSAMSTVSPSPTALPTRLTTQSPSSPSPSNVVVVSPPGRPFVAGEQGALITVRDYALQLRFALSTGSSTRLRQLSAPECRQCAEDARLIDERISAGRHFVNFNGSDGYRSLVVGPRGRDGKAFIVHLEITDSPNRFVDRMGKTIQVNAHIVSYVFVCVVRYEGARPLIATLNLVERVD